MKKPTLSLYGGKYILVIFLISLLLFGVYLGASGFEKKRLRNIAVQGFEHVESDILGPTIQELEQAREYTAFGVPWSVSITPSVWIKVTFFDFNINLAKILGIHFVEIDSVLCAAYFKQGSYILSAYDNAIEACSRVIATDSAHEKYMSIHEARFTRAMAYIKLAFLRAGALSSAEYDLKVLAETDTEARIYLEKIMLLKAASEGKKDKNNQKKEPGRSQVPPLFKNNNKGNEKPKGF